MTVSCGPDFAEFLTRELGCTASEKCRWRWEEREKNQMSVFCPGCGSAYPWRDTFYLRRIYILQQRLEAQKDAP